MEGDSIDEVSSARAVYQTKLGRQITGDSLELLNELEDESVALIVTSPPFALLREKSYGNRRQAEYVDWLTQFGKAAKRVLAEDGSFVIDLGGAYVRGRPVKSLHSYRVLLRFIDELDYRLAGEFFWHNPSRLPGPAEWVNKRKIRATDTVNTVWWFSVSDFPKADARRVRTPYSKSMKTLLDDPRAHYREGLRPSEHEISLGFDSDNGGALPRNLLSYSNSRSNTPYLRRARRLSVSHPARFPIELPTFFIEFLTDPGDLVVDIFSGSNTTGLAAERLERRWLSCDVDPDYAASSLIRFLDDDISDAAAKSLIQRAMRTGNLELPPQELQSQPLGGG